MTAEKKKPIDLEYLNKDLQGNCADLPTGKLEERHRDYYATPGVHNHYPPPKLCPMHAIQLRKHIPDPADG